MTRTLISLMTLILMQVTTSSKTTSEDVWSRAEDYLRISEKLQLLIKAEHEANNRYVQEMSHMWFQNWENEVHRSAVYNGYLGCDPNQVINAISLIRSKLEKDAHTCMKNTLAEHDDLSNLAVRVAEEARIMANSSAVGGNLDVLMECIPDPMREDPDEEILRKAPPHIRQVARSSAQVINMWDGFQHEFEENRKACFGFHSMEYHGTTADIVFLFEECVRGEITDWVYADPDPNEMEIQTLFKLILRKAYTRPARSLRSLTGMFDDDLQGCVTTVRKSHTAQSTELISYYDSQSQTPMTSPCSRFLPQHKTNYAGLIREAYQCLHGTYTNFLVSKKLMQYHEVDINRLTMSSTHFMDVPRHNISTDELAHRFKEKVLPTFDLAQEADGEAKQQYNNDIVNIQTHMDSALLCVKNARRERDGTSLNMSKEYMKCPKKEKTQREFIKQLESDHLVGAYLRIDKVHQKALNTASHFLKTWKAGLVRRLTTSTITTPMCQTPCSEKAFKALSKLQHTCQEQCWQHLNKVRVEIKQRFEDEINLRKLLKNSRTADEMNTLNQCLQSAMLMSHPTAKKFEINGENCGSYFTNLQINQIDDILTEFRSCSHSNCYRTWKFVVRSWGFSIA